MRFFKYALISLTLAISSITVFAQAINAETEISCQDKQDNSGIVRNGIETRKAFKIDDFYYVITSFENKEVKLVEPANHIQTVFDALTLYTCSEFDLPEYVTIDNFEYKVKAIESNALSNFNYYYLRIPETMRMVESGVGCSTGLETLKFEEGVVIIEDNCFNKNFNLSEITLPGSLLKIGDNSFNENGVKTIIFNSGIQSIGNNCFRNNSNVEELTLPESLEKIGEASFCVNSNLKRLVLPRWIGPINQCFNNCPNISVIECTSKAPSTLFKSFNQVDKSKCVLIVPDGCREVYEKRVGWNEFNIAEKSEINDNRSESNVNSLYDSSESRDEEYYTLDGIKINSCNISNSSQIFIQKSSTKSLKLIGNRQL